MNNINKNIYNNYINSYYNNMLNGHDVLLGISALLTPLLYYTRHSIPQTVGLLIVLDLISYNYQKEKKVETHTQVVLHKVLSVVQYAVAIFCLGSLLPKRVQHIALSFLLMRAIGVVHHAHTKDSMFFVVFFDFIKEYLLLVYVYFPELTAAIMLEGVTVKIAYEYLVHKAKLF